MPSINIHVIIQQEPAPILHVGSLNQDYVGECEITAENMLLCRSNSLLEGVAAWFASFYVFNFLYPKCYKNTLVFMQKGLLNINDKIKMPMAVLNAIKLIAEKRSK